MKKLTRRDFLRTSALTGAAAALAGTMPLAASAAAPEEENCLNAIKSLGNKKAIEMVSVQLAPGRLIGFEDNGLYTFRGVPYATAKRFQSPVPVTSYQNGWQLALDYGPVSPQPSCFSSTATPNSAEFMTPSNGTADMVGNENCQYLNVWTSSLTSHKPVIVFFHGGGMTSGASTELSYYTGEFFARRQDAVFVSVNHRLNVLGYLDLSEYGPEYENSAIAGLDDCVVALQWVHDNIAKFGGDPDNVTILGQSGGGIKVSTLACMSNTVGLFNKVFMMSGMFSNSSKEDALASTKRLVDYLGLKPEEVVEKLTTMDYESLYRASSAARCSHTAFYGTGTFETPMIDKDGKINPYAAQRTWIIGATYSEFNSNSSPLIYNQDHDSYLPDITDEIAADRLRQRYGDKTDQIIAAYRKAYPTHKLGEALFLTTSRSGGLSRWGYIDPENGYLAPMARAGMKMYNYVVSYTMPYFGGQVMHHTGDIPFWFNSIDTIMYQMYGDEVNARHVADTMSSSLQAFMETGDPSLRNLEWKPYTTGEHNTMVFDTKSACKKDFDTELFNLLMSK